jgi:hypothetical protein
MTDPDQANGMSPMGSTRKCNFYGWTVDKLR